MKLTVLDLLLRISTLILQNQPNISAWGVDPLVKSTMGEWNRAPTASSYGLVTSECVEKKNMVDFYDQFLKLGVLLFHSFWTLTFDCLEHNMKNLVAYYFTPEFWKITSEYRLFYEKSLNSTSGPNKYEFKYYVDNLVFLG